MARRIERDGRKTVHDEAQASLFEFVGDWLSANDWQITAHAAGGWYAMSYHGLHADWRVIVDCSETAASRRVLVYSVFPVRVPAGRRSAVSEFLTRANYGMPLATFELDFDDGEVRLRTVAETADSSISGETIDRLLMANLGASDRYLPALLGVAFGRLDPAEAVALSEVVIEGALQ